MACTIYLKLFIYQFCYISVAFFVEQINVKCNDISSRGYLILVSLQFFFFFCFLCSFAPDDLTGVDLSVWGTVFWIFSSVKVPFFTLTLFLCICYWNRHVVLMYLSHVNICKCPYFSRTISEWNRLTRRNCRCEHCGHF